MPSTTKPLPDEASIIVIGRGIMGLSTLYHAAKTCVKGIDLQECSKPTSRSTWHSAAQVRRDARQMTRR